MKKNKKKVRVFILLEEAQKNQIKKMAQAARVSMSEIMRDLINSL